MAKKSQGKKKPETRRQLIAAAISECRDLRGNIVPKLVVAAARDPKSVLHDEFEWDTAILVQQALEARAAELIRQCRDIVVYGERKIVIPTYISNPKSTDAGYVRTMSIARNTQLKTMALESEIARIKSAVHRAMSLAMAFGLESKFETMLQQLVDIELELMKETA